MEGLAVLRQNVSPRRNNGADAYLQEDEEIALPTPYTSPPSSPRRAFTMEVAEESPLGEVRAAVPFVWELIPGIPKDNLEKRPEDVCVFFDVAEETGSQGHGSSSSSDDSETLSRDSSNVEFEFCTRFEGIVEPSMSTAEMLFSNGQALPLRLPPRLQAVKHLRNSDSSCSDVSSCGSFSSYHSPQSPRSPQVLNAGSKLMLCGFIGTPDRGPEEVTILGMKERKQKGRSLSPLRFLNTESSAGRKLSSKTYSSSDSASSVSSFSSSSSRGETNPDSPHAVWDSPNWKRNKGRTLNDLVPDMAIASGGIEDLKVTSIKEITQDWITKPQAVESRRESLKKHQDKGFAAVEKIGETRGTLALSPQRSPSYAKSRLSSLSSFDMHFKSSRKEHMGRALFANRFGMLGSCLGMPPASP